MSPFDSYGGEPLSRGLEKLNVDVLRQFSHPLARILAFFDYTIDEVVNRPEVKRKVLGAYKTVKRIHRHLDERRAARGLRWGLYR